MTADLDKIDARHVRQSGGPEWCVCGPKWCVCGEDWPCDAHQLAAELRTCREERDRMKAERDAAKQERKAAEERARSIADKTCGLVAAVEAERDAALARIAAALTIPDAALCTDYDDPDRFRMNVGALARNETLKLVRRALSDPNPQPHPHRKKDEMDSNTAYEKAAEVLDSDEPWEQRCQLAGNWIRLADSLAVNERHWVPLGV